jgi:hypothetical protein
MWANRLRHCSSAATRPSSESELQSGNRAVDVDIDVMASRYVAPMRGFSEIRAYARFKNVWYRSTPHIR